ncbi:hypothetical protein [Phenylobacterium sp.]|uniref:hypothetical protein n=1 Tax=Phenylobacterium sp. TaxID=1871053 RepID=UPI0035B0A6EC
MAVTPNSVITPQSIKTANAVCTAAKTTYDDAAAAVLLLTAGANGGVLYGLKAVARATVTATKCQLYRYDGANYNLIASTVMSAYTMAATSAQAPTDFGFNETAPLRLAPGDALYVAIGVALAGGVVFDAQYEEL